MTDHDTRQIIIALTAIVLAWSIACLLTITFGQPFPEQVGRMGGSPELSWRPAARATSWAVTCGRLRNTSTREEASRGQHDGDGPQVERLVWEALGGPSAETAAGSACRPWAFCALAPSLAGRPCGESRRGSWHELERDCHAEITCDTRRHAQPAAEDRGLIDAAATLTSKPSHRFRVGSGGRAAEDALLDRAVSSVSPEARTALQARLDEAPKPNDRLRGAMQTAPPWQCHTVP